MGGWMHDLRLEKRWSLKVRNMIDGSREDGDTSFFLVAFPPISEGRLSRGLISQWHYDCVGAISNSFRFLIKLRNDQATLTPGKILSTVVPSILTKLSAAARNRLDFLPALPYPRLRFWTSRIVVCLYFPCSKADHPSIPLLHDFFKVPD